MTRAPAGALALKQEAERLATKEELLREARRTRKPLPFVATLPTFYCICGWQHEHLADSRDVIACDCGRSWVPIGDPNG